MIVDDSFSRRLTTRMIVQIVFRSADFVIAGPVAVNISSNVPSLSYGTPFSVHISFYVERAWNSLLS